MKSVLFVCMANICRSPALQATLQHLAAQRGLAAELFVDSCGIGWFHLGETPDRRTFEAAKKRGILIDHRAQQFQEGFFEAFDLILAVNPDIREQLLAHPGGLEHRHKIQLATDYSARFRSQSIPDPYYMSPSGFDEIMDIVVDACEGILKSLFP